MGFGVWGFVGSWGLGVCWELGVGIYFLAAIGSIHFALMSSRSFSVTPVYQTFSGMMQMLGPFSHREGPHDHVPDEAAARDRPRSHFGGRRARGDLSRLLPVVFIVVWLYLLATERF